MPARDGRRKRKCGITVREEPEERAGAPDAGGRLAACEALRGWLAARGAVGLDACPDSLGVFNRY
jgi:hypothetical protein